MAPALDAELDEGLVDAELAQLHDSSKGATDDYVKASKTPSEYSLPAAERYLLAKRLRRDLLSRTERAESSSAATICQVPALAVGQPSYPDAVGRDHVAPASWSSAAPKTEQGPPNDDGVVPCFSDDDSDDADNVSNAAGSAGGAAPGQCAKPAPCTYARVGGNVSRTVLKRRRSGGSDGAVPASLMPGCKSARST